MYAKATGCLVTLYAAWFVLVVRPARSKSELWGPRWLAVRASSVLYNFGCWYLKFSVNTEEAIASGVFDPDKQYVIAWHPHGAFTVAALYFFCYFTASSAVFPRNKLYCAVADLLLNVPVLAEFLLLVNSRSSDSKTLTSLIKNGKIFGIQPGGIYEQVRTDSRQEVIYFTRHLGFIRLAIKQGIPILPIYAFGENQLYDTSAWMRKLNTWLYDKFKVGNLLVHSGCCFGLPVSPLIPNPLLLPVPGRGLHLRWGEPIEVGPATAEPSDELVEEVFQKYCSAVQKLFDKHKDECLPKEVADKGLKIVVRGKKRRDD